jgi:hypothetical protein
MTEIGEAITEEGSLVFAELTGRIDHDLRRVAREMGESGGYRSGDRVQALQSDVTDSLEWLGEALLEEKKRREEQEQQDGPPAPKGENRLVPDVAELKLLGRMEREVLDNIDELLVLYPELEKAEDIDPLLLEEIGTLAVRHRRTTALFKVFRERLKLPEPGKGLSEEGVPGKDGESSEAGEGNDVESDNGEER